MADLKDKTEINPVDEILKEMEISEIPQEDSFSANLATEKNSDEKKTSIKREIFEWIRAIGLSFVVVFVIFHFVIQVVNVEGVSMQPTLQQNDRLVISKLFYHPASGDIVVLSDKTGLKKPLIKRIIAVEGQQLDIGEDGVVSVDGVPLEEPYIQETIQKTMRGDHVYPVTIPQDHVFVMGDNRNNSTDSRFEELFFVNEKEILGRVLLRIYPLNKFGTINE